MTDLTMLVYGDSGTGKSWLAQTTPAPRLVIDAESGGARFARRNVDGKLVSPESVVWDPETQPPPKAGDWEVCFVKVRQFDDLLHTYTALMKEDHPFKSVVIDSLTEVQDICKETLRTGDEVMNERMWGVLLDRMKNLVKAFRDLRQHPANPVDVVLVLALSHVRDGKHQPLVQGSLRDKLPGWVDVVGASLPTTDEEGEWEGRLLIRANERYLAKDRTHTLTEAYGPVITHPDVESMLDVLSNGDK